MGIGESDGESEEKGLDTLLERLAKDTKKKRLENKPFHVSKTEAKGDLLKVR